MSDIYRRTTVISLLLLFLALTVACGEDDQCDADTPCAGQQRVYCDDGECVECLQDVRSSPNATTGNAKAVYAIQPARGRPQGPCW